MCFGTAGTADRQDGVFFGIKVDERVTGKLCGIKAMSAVHTGFFVGRKDCFERRMRKRIVLQNS